MEFRRVLLSHPNLGHGERQQEARRAELQGQTGLALRNSVSPDMGTKANGLRALNEDRLTYKTGTGGYHYLF